MGCPSYLKSGSVVVHIICSSVAQRCQLLFGFTDYVLLAFYMVTSYVFFSLHFSFYFAFLVTQCWVQCIQTRHIVTLRVFNLHGGPYVLS